MMKRRDLLKMSGSSLALASLGLALPARAAGPGIEAAAGNGYHWSQAGAEALVGQSFWLSHPLQGAIGLTLEAVRAAGVRADASAAAAPPAAAVPLRAPALEQFSLYFVGPAGAGCAADSYEMDHAQIGRFALYLTPDEKRTGANVYRADFSLLV
ncbi:hypothetical protein [Massilia sp. NR 4-1]|uniref:DUF6916 family protein n=1 Tax=Massilia sp. NR 4-1 TaxID=1678028 RepID=UPI000A94FD5F|nr:hypothetical protein [Massilia sp. NR 4-1]